MLKEFSVAKIAELAAGHAPFFLEHCLHEGSRGQFCLARHSRARAPANIPTRTISSRSTHTSAKSSRRSTRRACSTTPSSSSPPTTARNSIAGPKRLYAVPRRQGLRLGGRRARARHRLLERHHRAWSARATICSTSWTSSTPRCISRAVAGQDSDRPLHRRHRPDLVPARRQWPLQPREGLHLERAAT